jgi:hypothetical protein
MATTRIIEIIGSSEHGWSDAVHNAGVSGRDTAPVGRRQTHPDAKIGPTARSPEHHVKIAFKVLEGDEA